MAGYSGTPLPKKLGIREDYSVVLVNAPQRFERKLEPLPSGAEFVRDAHLAKVAVLFSNSRANLARAFRPLAKASAGTARPACFARAKAISAGPVFMLCSRPKSVFGQPPNPPFQFSPKR